jgi:beta-alanine degradation protein BauB
MSSPRTDHHALMRLRVPLAVVALGFAGGVLAQAVPPGFVASPDIYKVIAENDKYRVIEVTWKPGQKDLPHSHPDAAVYYLTNCTMRNLFPGRPPIEGSPIAGTVRIQAPIASHTVENIGSTDCRLIMFEPK